MYKGTLQVLETNTGLYSSMTIMIEAVNEFKNRITAIDQADADFVKVTKGATATKLVNEDNLVSVALKLANVLFIYAARNKNEELKHDTKWTKSAFELLRDTELANRARVIINKADSFVTELAGYGITPEFITEVKNILADFELSLSKQQEKHAERSMMRQSLRDLFTKADDVLNEQLDPFIEMFSDTQTDFYNQYKSARVIKDIGHRSDTTEPEEETPVN